MPQLAVSRSSNDFLSCLSSDAVRRNASNTKCTAQPILGCHICQRRTCYCLLLDWTVLKSFSCCLKELRTPLFQLCPVTKRNIRCPQTKRFLSSKPEDKSFELVQNCRSQHFIEPRCIRWLLLSINLLAIKSFTRQLLRIFRVYQFQR